VIVQSVLELCFSIEGCAAIVKSESKAWIEINCLCIIGNRTIKIFQLFTNRTAIIETFSKSWIQFQRPRVIFERSIVVALQCTGIAPVIICLGIARIESNGSIIIGNGATDGTMRDKLIGSLVIRLCRR